MNAFKAFRIHEREGKIAAGFEQLDIEALTAGDVVVRVNIRASTTRTRSPRPARARSCASTH